jgi:6-phosphogluconate dehydrogenase
MSLVAGPLRYLGKPAFLIEQMKRAFCAGIVVTFAQGLALLAVASKAYKYYLALEDVTRIWRGSIIRSPILQEICEAYYVQPQLPNLLADSQFAHKVLSRPQGLEGRG